MSHSKHLLFLFLGTVFWSIAALIIHFAGARVFSAGNPNLGLFFGLAIPLTILSLYLTTLVSGVRFHQLLEPVVVMTFAATFLDAVALTWFRPLYSRSFEVALHGAAWILWGVGLGLLFAYGLHLAGPFKNAAKAAEPERH